MAGSQLVVLHHWSILSPAIPLFLLSKVVFFHLIVISLFFLIIIMQEQVTNRSLDYASVQT